MKHSSPGGRRQGDAADPIRLTGTSFAVLALIDHLTRATPYDLECAAGASVNGFWPVPHTTFYSEPVRLADAGYLVEERELHGRRRKLYSLTDAGLRALRAWTDEPLVAYPQVRDEGMLKIFAGADPVPLLTQRRAWHAEQIAQHERRIDEMRQDPNRCRGASLTIAIGLDFHRRMLGALVDVIRQQ